MSAPDKMGCNCFTYRREPHARRHRCDPFPAATAAHKRLQGTAIHRTHRRQRKRRRCPTVGPLRGSALPHDGRSKPHSRGLRPPSGTPSRWWRDFRCSPTSFKPEAACTRLADAVQPAVRRCPVAAGPLSAVAHVAVLPAAVQPAVRDSCRGRHSVSAAASPSSAVHT